MYSSRTNSSRSFWDEVPSYGSPAYSLKLHIVDVINLPSDATRPFLKAWVFANSADPQIPEGFSGVNNLERYAVIASENVPQLTTRIRSSSNDSMLSDSFTFTEAVQYFHDKILEPDGSYASERRQVNIAGNPLAIVISVHTSGALGMEEMIGLAQIQDLRPGNVVERKCPLYRSDRGQASLRKVKPGILHLKIEYVKKIADAGLAVSEYISNSEFYLSTFQDDTLRSIQRRKGPSVITSPNMPSAGSSPLRQETSPSSLWTSLEAMSLHQRNLFLTEEISRSSSRAPLHAFIYETQSWQFVEGFQTSALHIEVKHRKKPVVIRCCDGRPSQITLHLHGEADMILAEKCTNVRLIVTCVSREIAVANCTDLELVVGGCMPRLLLVGSRSCNVVLWKNTWKAPLQSIACSNIVIDAANAEGRSLEPSSLLTAPIHEKVLLPDMLVTEFKVGTMTTQCDFTVNKNPVGNSAASLRPTNGFEDDASSYRRLSPPLSSERERMTYRVSSPSISHLTSSPDVFGVGIMLRKEGNLFKVEKLQAGGAAWRDGRVKVGDTLVAIDGVSTSGKTIQEVGRELTGQENSKVLLSLNRSGVKSALPNLHVILHRCALEDNRSDGADGLQHMNGGISLNPNNPSPSSDNHFTRFQDSPPLAPKMLWKDDQSITSTANHTEQRNDSEQQMPPEADKEIPATELRHTVGVGLGIRPNADGTYSVFGIVPGSAADASGRIRINDIVQTVDGQSVQGKPYEYVRNLLQGPPGTQVLVNLMHPETPGRWFQVPMIRGVGTTEQPQSPLSQTLVQTPPAKTEVTTIRKVVNVASLSSESPRRASLTPVLLEHRPHRPEEAVAIALWLEEDYDLIAGDSQKKGLFSTQMAEDIAISLQTSLRRIVVVDVLKGVVADINILSDLLGDSRSPAMLAAELVKMAGDPTGKLRLSRTTCKVWHAEVRGPVSQTRPLREVLKSSNMPHKRLSQGIELSIGHILTVNDNSAEYNLLRSSSGGLSSPNQHHSQTNLMHDRKELHHTSSVEKPSGNGEMQHSKTPSNDAKHRTENDIAHIAEQASAKSDFERSQAEELPAERLQRGKRLEKRERQRQAVKMDEEGLADEDDILRERRRKLEEEEQQRRKQLEDEEQALRKRLDQEEMERRRKSEAEELERKQRLDREEQDRRKRLDEEEKARRLKLEEIDRIEQERRKRLDEEEKARRLKLEEEERQHLLRLEELEQQRKKALDEEIQEVKSKQEAQSAAPSSPKSGGSINFFDKEMESASSVLEILVLSSQNLPNVNKGTFRGAFCRVDFCGQRLETKVSGVSDSSDWNESFVFDAADRNNLTELTAEVFFWNQALIGGLMIPAEEIAEIYKRTVGWQSETYTFTLTAKGKLVVGANKKAAVLNLKFRVIYANAASRSKESSKVVKIRSEKSQIELEDDAFTISEMSQSPHRPIENNAPSLTLAISPRHIYPIRQVVLKRDPNPDVPVASMEKVGVGISFQATRQSGQMVVVGIVPGSSAEKSRQVHIGDIIHRINHVPVQGMAIPDVVNLIKGKVGTEVFMELQSSDVIPPANAGTLYASAQMAPNANIGPQASPGSLYVSVQAAPSSLYNSGSPAANRALYSSHPDSPWSNSKSTSSHWGGEYASGPKPNDGKVVLLQRSAQGTYTQGPLGVGMAFIVREGQHIVSALAPQGSAETSGQVQVGDIILAVDDVPIFGRTVEQVISLIKGPPGSIVKLLLEPGVQSRRRSMPLPSGRSSSPLARNLANIFRFIVPASGAEPGRQGPPSQAGVFTLTVVVSKAAGLQPLPNGRLPRAACKLRLLYPDWEPFHWTSISPAREGLEADYGGKELSVTVPPDRMDRVQLEVTVWDELALERSFMGQVLLNVRKFADPETTLGRVVTNNFPLRTCPAFEARRPIHGTVSLALRVIAPAS